MSLSLDISIIQWAAEECDRQKSGELSVANLCEAWLYLSKITDARFEPDLILTLGELVDPVQNTGGYRKLPVTVNGTVISSSNIEHQIYNLCEFSNVMTPIQFYTMFEEIHPFYDGNGRVGSLLYNFLSNTLFEPVAPPDIFADLPCMKG